MNATPFRTPPAVPETGPAAKAPEGPVPNDVDAPRAVEPSTDHDAGSSAVRRILARHTGSGDVAADGHDTGRDGDQFDLADRQALRRVGGLSTELEDVTEVEYRQLRLERVVLAGLFSGGSTLDAENSLRELAALAETAGSVVLDGVLQRRDNPDPATFLGSGKAAELRELVASTGADTVICDGELSPSQRRGLEDVVKV